MAKYRKVLNVDTGVIYNTLKDASEKEGMNKKALGRKLRGANKNNTNLKYVD